MRNVQILKRDIARRLKHQQGLRRVARLVARCKGKFCEKCGDVCPLRAARKFEDVAERLTTLLMSRSDLEFREFTLTRTSWRRPSGQLAETGLERVSKTLRRAFDSLQEPSVVGFGMIDAWWDGESWQVGAKVIAVTPMGTNLHRAFEHTRNLAGPLELRRPLDPYKAAVRLFREGQTAKCAAYSTAVLPQSIRSQYYAWLAELEPGGRIFRYGCDRYFNPLKKRARPLKWKPKKGHPSPEWLEQYRYGNHPWRCPCNICRNRRNGDW
jgi:hypothetical protein